MENRSEYYWWKNSFIYRRFNYLKQKIKDIDSDKDYSIEVKIIIGLSITIFISIAIVLCIWLNKYFKISVSEFLYIFSKIAEFIRASYSIIYINFKWLFENLNPIVILLKILFIAVIFRFLCPLYFIYFSLLMCIEIIDILWHYISNFYLFIIYWVVFGIVYRYIFKTIIKCFLTLYHFIIILYELFIYPPTYIYWHIKYYYINKYIFNNTCTSIQCSYKGFPGHTCPNCNEKNLFLYPNIYGVLKHYCIKCQHELSTINFSEKNHYQIICSSCNKPLTNLSTSKEKHIAIIGSPFCGKTTYLLILMKRILKGIKYYNKRIKAHLDNKSNIIYKKAWNDLCLSYVKQQKKDILFDNALTLHFQSSSSKNIIYFYDLPGDFFLSYGNLESYNFFSILDGIIFLVDPISLNGNFDDFDSFKLTTQSFLMKYYASSIEQSKRNLPTKLAITISKSDLPVVKNSIGNIKHERISGQKCREAIINWGGETQIRLMEQKFKTVEYFACSSLGKSTGKNINIIKPVNILDPLMWILNKNSKGRLP